MNKDSISVNEHDLPMIIRNNVRIDWVNLGEGHDGDYDPTDPADNNLLRFDVYHFNGNDWEAVEDGSYCTKVASGTDQKKLVKLLTFFMDTIYDDVSKHGKAKRLCEKLSWTE